MDGLDDLEEGKYVKCTCPLCPVWEYCKCGNCEECDYISTNQDRANETTITPRIAFTDNSWTVLWFCKKQEAKISD